MAFHFLDNFNGPAVASSGLVGRVPDLTTRDVNYLIFDTHSDFVAISGDGMLYGAPGAESGEDKAEFSVGWGYELGSPLEPSVYVTVKGYQAWTSSGPGSLPQSFTKISTLRILGKEPGSADADVTLDFYNPATALSVYFNIAEAPIVLAAGLGFVLTSTPSSGSVDRVGVGYQDLGLALPFDLTLHTTTTAVEVKINGFTVMTLNHVNTVEAWSGLLAGSVGEGVGISALQIDSTLVPTVDGGFATYPDALPGPISAPIQSAERRMLSSLPGARQSRALSRDRLAGQELQFWFSHEQCAVFTDWLENTLVDAGAWFAASWPIPQGGVGVRKFIGAPSYPRFYPGFGWLVSAVCEVRGRGDLPV